MTINKTKSRKRQTYLGIGVIAVILAVLSGIAWMVRTPQTNFPRNVSVQQAYQLYEQGTFVLDVRTQEEWDQYHAPNTTLIPLDVLPDRLAEIPADQQVVVVCRSGNRSQVGRDILLDAGFEQVTSVDGGLQAWGAAGYPLEGSLP
jgi:rhodanese-related sulfurtransferase